MSRFLRIITNLANFEELCRISVSQIRVPGFPDPLSAKTRLGKQQVVVQIFGSLSHICKT